MILADKEPLVLKSEKANRTNNVIAFLLDNAQTLI